MKQEAILNLELERHDVAQLARGRALGFQLGEQQIFVRFSAELLGAMSKNGKIETSETSADLVTAGRCSGCRRDLSDPKWKGKHSKACPRLRRVASRKRRVS